MGGLKGFLSVQSIILFKELFVFTFNENEPDLGRTHARKWRGRYPVLTVLRPLW